MAYTEEQLKEIFLGLPEDLQDAITSVETAIAVKKVGEKYKLHIDQIGELADEVGLVMIGVNSYRQFTDEIKRKLRLTGDQANGIATDINKDIFAKIREILKKAQLERVLADAPALPENENPAESVKASLFDQKMASLYNTPKEDVTIKKQTTDTSRHFDPYREQV